MSENGAVTDKVAARMSAPHSIACWAISIMGMDLIVHQLNTGERVVDAQSVERFFAAIGGPDTLTNEESSAIMRTLFHGPTGEAR